MSVHIRPRLEDPSDAAFLFELYATTRAEEIALVEWSAEEQEKFLRFQFAAQEQAYIHDYAGCADQVIEADGRPIGRLLTWRSANAICLLDIVLLPACRGQGIGTALVRGVMAEAEQEAKFVWLYVQVNNPRAERLYQRQGFQRRETVGAFYVMDWRPSSLASVEN